MTTSRKLWLGFGTLIAVLTFSVLAIVARLSYVGDQVGEMASIARVRSNATREIEINVAEYVVAVHEYLRGGDPAARADAGAEAMEVGREQALYERLAETDRQRELGVRFGTLWQEMYGLGESILVAPGGPAAGDLERFADLRIGLETFLDQEMQADAVAAYDRRRDEALGDLRTVNAFALALLGLGVGIAVVTSVLVGRGILRTERGRRAAADEFRQLADSAPAMLWVTDERNACTFLSRGWYELTGQAEGAGLGFGWLDAVHPDDRESARRIFEGAVARQQPFTSDYRLRQADGSYRWANNVGRPRFDADGRLRGYVGSVIDVHDRRAADERLRASEELVRTIAENSTQALVMMDDRGYVTYSNRACLEMTGYTAEEIRSRPLHYLIHHHYPDGRPYPMEECPIDRALPENFDVRAHADLFFRKDGSTFPVLCAASPIFKDGRPYATVVEVRDMTAARAAEEALLESQHRLQLVSDHVPALISYVDRDGYYRFNNGRYEEWFGTRAAEITGRHVRDVLGDAVYQQRLPFIERVLRGEMVRFEGPTRHRLLGMRQTELAYVPDLRPDGEIHGFYVMAFDITERTHAEQALREADRRKDEFLATLAHELRNPLAPIRMAIGILKSAPADRPQIEKVMAMMDRQVSQLVRLIDDLLDVSRISRGKITLRRERVEIAAAVHDAVEALRPLCVNLGHELVLQLPPGPLAVDADATRLTQIVGNLLNNACKFTPPGGRIVLDIRAEDGQVALRVRDTGVGIAPEQLPRIFEMFSQVDTSLERSSGGLGIGLTLVKTLVEMHGGTIEAHSAGLGRGSEFVVRLPLTDNGLAAPPQAPPAQADTAPRKVLVVDDNRDLVESLVTMLQLQGHEVYAAFDGEAAVAEARRHRPDVILLDIGLPRMNGYDAARRIREQPENAGVLLVAVTGWGQDADRRRSRDAGFDAHLVKPLDEAALARVVSGAVVPPPERSERDDPTEASRP